MAKEISKHKKLGFFDKQYWSDVVKTIPLKIVILSMSGGAICIFPFLVLQMQLLGINIKQIATLFIITPLASVTGPIVSGLVADKTGKYKAVFFVNVLLLATSFTLLLVVPPIEKTTVSVRCVSDSTIIVSYNSCRSCVMSLGSNEGHLILQDCIFKRHDNGGTKTIGMMESTRLDVDDAVDDSKCTTFNITNEMHLIVTNPTETSTTCDLEVLYNNDTSGVNGLCYSTATDCDYECSVQGDLNECGVANVFSKTYLMFGAFLFAVNFFAAAAFTMMDASLITYCKENNLELGKQKIMTVLAFGLVPLLSGFVTDLYTEHTGTVSYFPAFMLSDCFFLITLLALLVVNLKADLNEANIFKDLGKLMTRIEVDAFLVVVLIVGINFGFIESYIFIYLKSLGASDFLLGLTLTVGCLSSIPMLFYAEVIEMKIGRQNVFLLCFTAYAVRMVGYSFIQDPWMCLIFEVLEAFTYQLLWVTCLRICPLLAPKGLLATMTGLVGSVHYSVGKGIGGFLGGFMIEELGMRTAFRAFGGVAFAGGIIYFIIHHLILKKKFEERELQIEEEKRCLENQDEVENLMKKSGLYKRKESIDMEIQSSIIGLAASGKVITLVNCDDGTSGKIYGIRRSLPHIYIGDVGLYQDIIKETRSETNLSP